MRPIASLCIAFSSLLINSIATHAAETSEQPRPPNIVFILIDDMGYTDVGCYGSQLYETPHIDQLAQQGMRFTDAYAACSVCSPTRLSILAGKYPARVGLTNFLIGDRWPENSPLLHTQWQTSMPPQEITIAEALHQSGYVNGFIGKWHLDSREGAEARKLTSPAAQGFDFVGGKMINRTDKSASAMTDAAIEFITANKQKPFFLYLCLHSVHIPLEATPDLISKYEQRVDSSGAQRNPIYAAMVESVDQSVGRVTETLEQFNLVNNTIVVFISDNGGLHVNENGTQTPATSNLPLRGGKGYSYEGGIRVPLIIRWPAVVQANSVCSSPVSTIDFYPTFLQASGTTAQAEQTLDGESLLPLLRHTGELQRGELFWHYPHYSNQGGVPSGAIRQGDFKLIKNYHDSSIELYNLVSDIGEQKNLATAMPDKAAAMKMRFDEWLASMGAKQPPQNKDYDAGKAMYADPDDAPTAWQESGIAAQ